MIKLKIKESFSSSKVKLKELENDIYLSQDRMNDTYVITHPKNVSKLQELVSITDKTILNNEMELAVLLQEIATVGKSFFGNHKILES